MPELPDVEVYTKTLKKNITGKTIESVELVEESLLETPKKHLHQLQGTKVTGIDRQGKYCFIELANTQYLIMHFGMTGRVTYSRTETTFNHAALVLSFTDGSQFAYINIRKLGKMILTDQKHLFLKQARLGPDVLSLTQDQFRTLISSKQGMIKTTLMDQSLLSGIGNVYSDEILYHAQINPRRKTTDIQPNEMKRLHAQEKQVLRTAIKIAANPKEMPENWLIHRRKQGAACGICSSKIEKTTINGRGGFFCPGHQL
jgi:formamidopyrimidine-DNA glycosylase